jgi:type IV fimbrial biogenesis protein FimT
MSRSSAELDRKSAGASHNLLVGYAAAHIQQGSIRMARQPEKQIAARSLRGFTLTELMVTVAVASILIALAVPNFRRLTISNSLTTAANDVVAALNLAKMEAIKRNGSTQFCSNVAATNTSDSLGTACNAEGTAVYVLTTGTTAVQVRGASAGIQTPVQLHGNIAALRFGGMGLAYQPGASATPFSGTVLDICSTGISTENHRVVAIATGSLITTTTATGACP